jgi:hypothetical protein
MKRLSAEFLAESDRRRVASAAEHQAARERFAFLTQTGDAIARANRRTTAVARSAEDARVEITRLTAEVDELRAQLVAKDEAAKDEARTLRYRLGALELSTKIALEKNADSVAAVAVATITKSKPRRTRSTPVRDPVTKRILHVDVTEIAED